MSMKGMELPINMIIVVAVALLVLITVFVFFLSGTSGGLGSIEKANLRNRMCTALSSGYQCNPANVNSITVTGYKRVGGGIVPVASTATDYSTSRVTLLELCQQDGLSDTIACARSCGCPV